MTIQSVELSQSIIPVWELVFRLALASMLGMAIGWEREAQDKSAGVRTHMLVGLGSCGFLLIVMTLTFSTFVTNSNDVGIDPSRVIQGVIGGIGFLGAGAIIHGGSDEVRGLTTGAGIWLVGGVGLATGAGAYIIAITMTLLSVFIIVVCGRWLKPIIKNSSEQ